MENMRAKKRRDEAWRRMKRKQVQERKEEYQLERNESVRVRREEVRRYEKYIVDKYKEEPKLFYRFINGKIKHKEIITRLKKNNEVYEDPKEISEVLNKNFQKVFTTESDFKKPQGQVRTNEMWEIGINRKEIEEMMKELDERKAIGPDEVSGYILKK